MKKYFYYAIALMSMATVSFTSCDDDDDNEKKEVKNPTNPQTLGQESQKVMDKLGDGSEADLMSSVSKLSDADALQAAKVLIEYNKNKANESWIKSFTEAAATASISSDKVKEMLDQAVEKLSSMGFLKENVSAEELATMLSMFKDQNMGGETTKSGTEAAKKYESFFDENREAILSIDPKDTEGAVAAFLEMSPELQGIIMAAVKEYDSHKNDESWKKDFIGTVAMKYSSDDASKLKDLFDTFGPYAGTI